MTMGTRVRHREAERVKSAWQSMQSFEMLSLRRVSAANDLTVSSVSTVAKCKTLRICDFVERRRGVGGEKCYQALSFVVSVIGAPSSSSHSATSPHNANSTHITSATVREVLSARWIKRSTGNLAVIFSTGPRGSRFPV